MSENPRPDRRRFLKSGLGTAAAMLVGGCEPLSRQPWALNVLGLAESLNYHAHRLLLPRDKLAQEFSEAEISPYFKPNGTRDPADEDYRRLAAGNFSDWRLLVDGLVERPAQLSLAELRELPSRTQITRHDCVEGWSCVGKWKGARLGPLLERVGLQPRARFIVFHCADSMQPGSKYYESIDLVDAFHPQTILAYEMNDRTLPVAHGAPIRLRVERQLGYKMAKYVMRIEAVESFAHLGAGKGGYWEDHGYDWYAGI
jgi:DMSO/TMAO reductase YedYZ molybdopterin-dependent catalytic subunit